MAERTLLRLVGGLLLGGLVVQQIANLDHPGLNDDNYQAVFAKYADSTAWIAVHFIQYAGVLLFLGGLLVLYRVLRVRSGFPCSPARRSNCNRRRRRGRPCKPLTASRRSMWTTPGPTPGS